MMRSLTDALLEADVDQLWKVDCTRIGGEEEALMTLQIRVCGVVQNKMARS